ncbi:MAG: hypothetical protein MUC31_04460, partial [Bacteroidales bacterium]|nr:hypothetical protein [Bacteroidales bacterium]
DPDQDATLESRSDIIPHTGLLKARLLCDGGYFKEAGEIMASIDPVQLDELAYRLEYHYRNGRILQLSGQVEKAVRELVSSFDQGKNAPYTYATRSALQLGRIYEKNMDYAKAALWYNRCIEVYSGTHTTEGVKEMAEKGVKRAKDKL